MTIWALMMSLSVHASTLTTGWVHNPQHPPVAVRLMLTGEKNEANKTVEGLLEVKLDKDWKTYWRSPGEGGTAPSINWELSSNLNSVDWHWPLPKRYEFLGVETLGYKHDVIFPMTFHLDDMNKPVFLSGKLTMSSCTSICVLTDYELSLDFNPEKLVPSVDAMVLYNKGNSLVPKPSTAVELTQVSYDEAKKIVSIVATNKAGWTNPDVFVDGQSKPVKQTSFLTPKIDVSGEQLIAQVPVSSWFGTPKLVGEPLSVTITDKDIAVELSKTADNKPVIALQNDSLLKVIGLALLGGLILNIMPCVLPVLGMKLSSVISAKGLERRQIRAQFIASALGILVSFWLLAGFLALLKVSGQALGWGVQFQSPWFIGAMMIITGLFAANMLGLFEIRLSSNTNTWLATRGGNSYGGHFVQGMFATLLATPCSAPFLGTAVAFALGANYLTLFAIFTALAVGMAAPWLLIALFPQLANALPKPGMWMNTVKTIFGLMMLVTSLWLLSLMANFFSLKIVIVIGVIALALLLSQLWRIKGKRATLLTVGFLIIVTAIGLIIGSLTADKWAKPLPQDHHWTPLNVEQIKQDVAQGKTVFVDVTADWCITCKANKVGVILQEPVYSALDQENIVLMRGDWTKPSDYVTNFLQSHGRFGVPFNIVYGPAAPNGIELPVILTSEQVLDALKQASSKE
ncbi:TPA: protein-disulfide reductase DsbD family protein [Photobacterium damselae]|uniref:protein-disulfide reductase DsbD family protein n=1 Tax=Photobacterium damselae TaxID=38293 RepID=UPI00083B6B2B|nr:protein-disulfide reductase DsbD domain-containing protein [Photobacterium damselae]MBA5685212.1 thioredoxin family protein [Photobacterium damselae subsp. damselae]MCG3816243.1 thioredoxin family protein [Photobacterium damselae]NVH51458.1 thioredoxin family protein [Photobacterium damselae subsp. damselae]NVO75694.1 thioredoxin family protein [Photobacterium damselae subsp. damselae]NVO81759.1 thioredoxin family protein [Photobacterium damselae subsp. damselae]